MINKQVFRTIFMFVVMAVIAFFSADIVQASGTSNSPLDVMDATSVKPLQKQRNSQDKLPVQKLPKLLSKRESILQTASNPYYKDDVEITYDDSGNQTATVYTAQGLLEAIYDPANPGYSFNNGSGKSWKDAEKDGSLGGSSYLYVDKSTNASEPVSKINKIILANDINLCDVPNDTNNKIAQAYKINLPDENRAKYGVGNEISNDSSYKYVPIRHDKLTICTLSDSQQININMGYNDFALTGAVLGPQNSSYPYKEDWTIKNLNIYGTSYWGFVSCNTGIAANYELAHSKVGQPDPTNPDHILAGQTDETRIAQAAAGEIGGYSWLTYENTKYIGSQFAWTHNGTSGVTIKGTVYANSVFSYKIPSLMNNSSYIWKTYHGGDQQNFEVERAVFDKDSHFYGSTYASCAFELTGTAQLKSGATVDLYPHGYVGDNLTPEHRDNSLAWGFYFKSGGPRLDLYGDSKLNIHCNMWDGNDVFGENGKWESGVSIDEETAAGISSNSTHNVPKATSGALDMADSNSIIAYHETKDEDGKMLSPEINIDSDGPIYGNHQLVNFGGGNAELSHGKFSIDAKNLNNASNDGWHYKNTPSSGTGGLMTVSGKANITVKTGGDFSIAAHNKSDADSSEYPVTLLYYSGGQINLMNPKNVSLDLRDHNDPDSVLVYAPNQNTRINAYDTRIQAQGDNTTPEKARDTSIGVSSSRTTQVPLLTADDIESKFNIKYNPGQTISLGMGDSSDANGGICTPIPIRAQTLTLPFFKYAIDFVQYLTQPADNVIQGHKTDLDLLKAAMVQMNGREFRYVRLSDLPGPTEDAVDKVGVPGASSISQKDITGQVGGDYWANDDESDKTLFSPVPPLLRVQLLHKDDKSAIDLGTVSNGGAAMQKTKETLNDAMDPSVTEVTPNPIDSNRNVRTDTNGNYIIGKKITTGNDTSNPQPHYLDPKIVTWDKNGWSKDTSSSENDPQHSFSYNLQEVLENYNKNHTDKKISFKPGDQVLTSVVTNYQETPVQNTRITNLYLQKGDEPKTPFLVGDKVTMPFQYIDMNPGASNLFLSGTIYKLVNDDGNITRKKEVCTFNKQQVDDIKQSNELVPSSLNLPTETTSKPGATSEPGNYVVEFYGTDDVGDSGNAGPDDPISWNYTVSNLPKYNGKTVLNDHTTGDTTKPSNIVSNLHYTVKTVFEAVNTTNGALSKVKFKHPDNSDINIEENSDYTLTASYIDKGQTINKQLESDFKYNTTYYYTPGDFGINQGTFPKGVKFTITYKTRVNAENKAGVQIGADQMYSKEGNDGEDILLGTSNSIKYNSVGSIVLSVGDKPINYGTNPVAVPLKKERVFFIPKTKDPIVWVTNNTPYSQPIILTAQVDGDTSGLNNWLYYRKTKDNADYSDTLMTNKVTVFHDSVGTNVPQNISSSWFNPKTGEQVTGPILKLRQNSSPTPGTQYNTKITWNLTNSL
ncbi:hypothetical protein GYT97_01885 [Lactobacillus mellis]|uniref:hypothetical protein n=1 Tax=Bombilactobacillus mellis TaxID=1218508 RepID=UPI001580A33B|nr:hypothetical protein [Bombilactobacillus mellis]NUG38633.1 hypothetical protein [Bombilactobacillus mellis]